MQRPTKWSLEVRGAPLEAVTLLERIPRLLRFRLAGREDRLMVRLARRLGFPESASLELTVGEAEPRLRAYLGPAPARWRRHLPLERAGLLGLAQHPVARTLDGAVEPAASRLLQALRLERLTVLPLGCFDEGWRLLLLADGPRLAPDVLAGLRDAARVIVDAARLQQEAANPVATGSVPARTVSPGEGPRAAAAVADLPPMGAGGEEGRPSSGGDAGERRLVEKQRELLANVSHDLKNPLAAVSTSLQVLESGRAGEMNPTQRRLLGLARRNCDRLLKMVHELVDGERRAEAESILKRRSFDPLPLLRAAMADSEEVASQMHRTLAWVGDHGSKLWGDPEHFRRILDNLVDNALKFGGEDGHVLVTLRKDQLRQTDEIGRAAAALGLQVWGSVLQVEDDGPGFSEEALQQVTLGPNDSNKYEDRWVYVKICSQKSEFIRGSGIIYLPVAHAEGKFLVDGEETLRRLRENDQIVLRYVDEQGRPAVYPCNPNGSIEDIAGICDPTGRILGLMPHPERHMRPENHPRWTREGPKEQGDGCAFFENAVAYIRRTFDLPAPEAATGGRAP